MPQSGLAEVRNRLQEQILFLTSKFDFHCLYRNAWLHYSVVRHLLTTNRGLIKRIGVNLDTRAYKKIAKVDARGAWVTPGIFDMHSHLGVDSVGRFLLFVRRTKTNFV